MEYSAKRIEFEDNELLEDILKRNYYKDFTSPFPQKRIEFIFNRKNKFSQCYGCFNNDEKLLYPDIDFCEIDYDKTNENLAAFIDYYIENNFLCDIKLNGLDWANSDYAADTMDIIFAKFKNSQIYHPTTIYINTDCHFLLEENKLANWLIYAQNFKTLGITLSFNIYANGYYCDDNGFNEEFYSKLIEFVKKIKDYKIITYVRPNNVKNWIKNYEWWFAQLQDDALTHIQIEEEKTDKWNYDAISQYILFINEQIDYFYTLLGEKSNELFFDKNKDITFQSLVLRENHYLDNNNNNNNCDFFKNLTIDLTTMRIVPCPKVNYEDFACGRFIVKDKKIESIKAMNIAIIIYNTHLKQVCLPHCEQCGHIEHCSGHCLGEAYTKRFDMLVPIREFCNLSIAKINFLIYKYDSLGLITEENLAKLQCDPLYIKRVLDLNEKIKGGL